MEQKSRLHNSIKNVFYNVIIVVLNSIISFVSRTFFIKTLGAEILGLNGLFSEVIAVMSLAEMGVGMAIVFSLYKPLYEKNISQINELMTLYKNAYRIIAIAILLIGLVITFFVDRLITGVNYQLSYIRFIFVLFVIKTACSYLFSFKVSLLNADQKQYIVSSVSAVANVIFSIVTILLLINTKNYIVYLLIQIVQVMITNIVLSAYVDKHYPYLTYKERMCKEERNIVFDNIKNIFIKRVSGVVTSSTDNVLISTLVSTIQVGYYSNYVTIFAMIRTLYKQIAGGITASIGNLMVSENSDKCITVLRRLTYLYFVFSLIMASGLLGVCDLFIIIWLGKEYVMTYSVVLIAIANLFIEICCEPLWQYLEVSGLFKQDKNIGIFGSSVNLIVSVVLGMRIGIAGIFIGTICTQLIQLILKIKILFKNRFEASPSKYYWQWIKMGVGFASVYVLQYIFFDYIDVKNNYMLFLIKGLISVFIAVVIANLLFVNSDEQKYSLILFKVLLDKIRGKKNDKSNNLYNNL